MQTVPGADGAPDGRLPPGPGDAGPLGDLLVPERRRPRRRVSGRARPAGGASSPTPGRCNAFVWGGELQWLHGAGKPGGHAFCYFDGNDAVIVWTHERLGQSTHRDILATAREAGSDHVGLTRWWRPTHHLIGKAQ